MIKQLLPRDQKLGTLKVLARSSGCQYKYKIIQFSSIKVIFSISTTYYQILALVYFQILVSVLFGIIWYFQLFALVLFGILWYLQILVLVLFGIQSSLKRRITRIGTHVFSLGRMFIARREFCVRMFF